MGATDTKTISHQIDNNFRSLRKYHDPLYGQLTLVQSKSTLQLYALIQKIIFTPDSSFQQFIALRKQHNPYLVKLHQFYSCSVDYCSGLEKYFFLVEFSERTLYREMTQRQERGEMWEASELWSIFVNCVEILTVLRDPKSNMFRSYVSNHLILYQSPQQLKTLQSSLKVQAFSQHTFPTTTPLYLSPQSYTLLCNKQKLQSKTLSLTEKSIVFMLGMNFLQCALLADVSAVYNQLKKCVEFCLVNQALEEVGRLYGEEVFELVRGMMAEKQQERWSVQQIKEYMRVNVKRRKIITMPKHHKIQQLKAKQLKV